MLTSISIDTINSLTISELDALRFIENNRKQILAMSIKTLAQITFVSTATIMRLCKKLGYSGFSELKYHLREELNQMEKEHQNTTFADTVNQNVKAIVETAAMLDEKKIKKIVELMLQPTNIHFFGKGLTETVINYASKQLLTYNRANFIYQDTHIAYLVAESMTENDLLFACSLSGNTHQVVRMAQIAKSRKATVVTISSNMNNELSKIGDYNLAIYNEEDRRNRQDISSRLPILFILNIIITTYINHKTQIE
jgi:DNA-binding MurR/RpiR family transcriptional regulator